MAAVRVLTDEDGDDCGDDASASPSEDSSVVDLSSGDDASQKKLVQSSILTFRPALKRPRGRPVGSGKRQKMQAVPAAAPVLGAAVVQRGRKGGSLHTTRLSNDVGTRNTLMANEYLLMEKRTPRGLMDSLRKYCTDNNLVYKTMVTIVRNQRAVLAQHRSGVGDLTGGLVAALQVRLVVC